MDAMKVREDILKKERQVNDDMQMLNSVYDKIQANLNQNDVNAVKSIRRKSCCCLRCGQNGSKEQQQKTEQSQNKEQDICSEDDKNKQVKCLTEMLKKGAKMKEKQIEKKKSIPHYHDKQPTLLNIMSRTFSGSKIVQNYVKDKKQQYQILLQQKQQAQMFSNVNIKNSQQLSDLDDSKSKSIPNENQEFQKNKLLKLVKQQSDQKKSKAQTSYQKKRHKKANSHYFTSSLKKMPYNQQPLNKFNFSLQFLTRQQSPNKSKFVNMTNYMLNQPGNSSQMTPTNNNNYINNINQNNKSICNNSVQQKQQQIKQLYQVDKNFYEDLKLNEIKKKKNRNKSIIYDVVNNQSIKDFQNKFKTRQQFIQSLSNLNGNQINLSRNQSFTTLQQKPKDKLMLKRRNKSQISFQTQETLDQISLSQQHSSTLTPSNKQQFLQKNNSLSGQIIQGTGNYLKIPLSHKNESDQQQFCSQKEKNYEAFKNKNSYNIQPFNQIYPRNDLNIKQNNYFQSHFCKDIYKNTSLGSIYQNNQSQNLPAKYKNTIHKLFSNGPQNNDYWNNKNNVDQLQKQKLLKKQKQKILDKEENISNFNISFMYYSKPYYQIYKLNVIMKKIPQNCLNQSYVVILW
ncbi:hypothetical protein PPERSA_04824 [Pseudocohnilembus persalinus]|uniref:Uncharacterized protein n=1 Tax=Pseudocohnilembus persalinus TaxID=266149 RepID=A0A0V0QJC2_PSEPJ|nr:hypothetical protein PPERSA_04824 [Pseudocohnilembus persalinus]|eukprot:KRX02202.1 hypothetical protein PPERSA_04824 [Pseudocohnilembus persalinus]